jgi:hypothetical protein
LRFKFNRSLARVILNLRGSKYGAALGAVLKRLKYRELKIYLARKRKSRKPAAKIRTIENFAAPHRNKISFCGGFANFLAAKFSLAGLPT